MASLKQWPSLLDHQASPFSFVSGWRQPLGKGVCCSLHRHQAVEIVYHRRGAGITRLKNGESVSFAEGSFVLYAPRVWHDQVMERPGEDLCIHVAVPTTLSFTPACLVTNPTDGILATDALLLSGNRQPVTPREKRILDLRATALLFSVIEFAVSEQKKKLPPGECQTRKAEAYIRENHHRLTSLRDVADAAGLSQDHLRHVFKARRGISLVAFLARTRIERARTLLVHSRMSLKEVASLCGFRNEYYFSTVFTRYTGLPPGTYRARTTAE